MCHFLSVWNHTIFGPNPSKMSASLMAYFWGRLSGLGTRVTPISGRNSPSSIHFIYIFILEANSLNGLTELWQSQHRFYTGTSILEVGTFYLKRTIVFCFVLNWKLYPLCSRSHEENSINFPGFKREKQFVSDEFGMGGNVLNGPECELMITTLRFLWLRKGTWHSPSH